MVDRAPHLAALVPALAALAAVAAAGGLAGCGALRGSSPPPRPGHPPPSPATARQRALAAQADRSHELPTPVPHQRVIGGWRSPVQAVAVFANTYINWTAATISDRMQALAEVSVGQARSAVTLAAGQAARDTDLHRGGIANSGTVEAVALMPGTTRRYIVVTRERTTSTASSTYAGLAPAWHVTLATVTRVGGGLWVPSGWQPEN